MNAKLLLALLFLGLFVTQAFAYDTRFALDGTKVRITASERAFEGILVGQDPETLRVVTRREGEQRIAQADVSQFLVRSETVSHSKTGMVLGFLAGAVLGVVMDPGCDCDPQTTDRLLLAMTTALAGASVGALVGGAVPNERWVNVP